MSYTKRKTGAPLNEKQLRQAVANSTAYGSTLTIANFNSLFHFISLANILDDFSNTRLNSFIFWLELLVQFSSFGD